MQSDHLFNLSLPRAAVSICLSASPSGLMCLRRMCWSTHSLRWRLSTQRPTVTAPDSSSTAVYACRNARPPRSHPVRYKPCRRPSLSGLAREPVLPFCGLDPEHLLRAATVYDLIRRISQSFPSRPVVIRLLRRPKGVEKGKEAHAGAPAPSDGSSAAFAAIHADLPSHKQWQAKTIVQHSIRRGLPGPDARPAVTVDGNPLESGANCRGHSVCAGKKDDPCSHLYRRYADPGARRSRRRSERGRNDPANRPRGGALTDRGHNRPGAGLERLAG